MDFVNKKHIIITQIGENGCQITLTLDGRTAGHANVHVQLVGNNIGQSGFAKARRAKEQHMVQSLMTSRRSLDKDGKVILDLALADIFI